MKAWIINKYGGPEVLEFREIEKPKMKKGEVVIEVNSVGLNPYDCIVRNGGAKLLSGSKFPKVLGGDFSGIVIKAHSKNTKLKVGQQVYGFANIFMGKPGALAEQTVMKEKYIRVLPENISLTDSATLTSAALTALNGYRGCGELKGKTVLINGATGGVGHFATQIAVARGAIVTGVCSASNISFAKQLGAHHTIDYSEESILACIMHKLNFVLIKTSNCEAVRLYCEQFATLSKAKFICLW